MNETFPTRIEKKSIFDKYGQTYTQKKNTGDIHLCNKLIYLLKGGQLVIYSVPHLCCERITTPLRSSY